ncbi:hypothetical protein BG003_000337, partial [Podila horticola]
MEQQRLHFQQLQLQKNLLHQQQQQQQLQLQAQARTVHPPMTPFTTVYSAQARGHPTVGGVASSSSFIPATTAHTSLRPSHAPPFAPHIHPHSQLAIATAHTPAVSPQEWQGIVASGAMPVRQALHSFIASSCDKPPASKEEAQAVLEEMFRLRAEKVRRAIEQGKLATTEALRLRVCQRRESVGVSEGSHRATASPTSHTPDSEQKTSGCRQEKRVVSSILVAEPGMEMGQDLGSRGASLYNQSATWGLSDDEIMSSFTTFTAKLGDTLLARDGATNTNKADGNNTNSNSDIGFIKPEAIQIQTNVPVLSPTLGHSPTTSTESDSPSPWTPWIPLNNSNSNNNTHDPSNNVDVTQQNNRSGVQAPRLFAQTSLFPAFPQDI